MPRKKKILKIAKSVISKELEAISQLESKLNNSFSDGRVNFKVVKSNYAMLVRKYLIHSVTLNSTGQPSVFLHG